MITASRVIFVLGTWQLLIAMAAMEKVKSSKRRALRDCLVIYGPGVTDEMQSAIVEIARTLRSWDKIIWAGDLLSREKVAEGKSKAWVENIPERLKITDAREVWLCKLFSPVEKIIADAYKNSEIVLYEDGLHFYVPQQAYENKINLLSTKNPVNLYKNAIAQIKKEKYTKHYTQNGVMRSHLERTKKIYTFLANVLPMPFVFDNMPLEQIKNEEILRVINKISNRSEKTAQFHFSRQNKTILFLGQCFSPLNLSREFEIEIYYRSICRLIKNDYRVIWKEHPRSKLYFYDKLAQKLNSELFHKVEIPAVLPIEIFIERMMIDACVSVTSTSLFYASLLFNCMCFTVVHHLPKFRSRDFNCMATLVEGKVAKLEQLFN